MRYIQSILSLFFLLNVYDAFGQDATLKGTLTDAVTKEPLIGANISYGDGQGVTSDFEGNYQISLKAGSYNINFSYIGYHPVNKNITLSEGENRVLNISLHEAVDSLSEIVVTGSIFEKRASEEIISIEVIKPDFINVINPVRFDDIARRVTGLNVVDGQANIRSGSGWSYGLYLPVGIKYNATCKINVFFEYRYHFYFGHNNENSWPFRFSTLSLGIRYKINGETSQRGSADPTRLFW